MATIQLKNDEIAKMELDHYYHLGLDTSMNLQQSFGDVKFVLLGGTADRMEKIALHYLTEIWPLPHGCTLKPLGSTNRYHLYKIGSVICCSHGMGAPSIGILLHEITKLLAAAGATDVQYIRIGTCGGLKVPPGTVVITEKALNAELEPYYEEYALGKKFKRPSITNKKLSQEIYDCRQEGDSVVLANTMSVNCFYEAQGRLDGAICNYTLEEKMAFLEDVSNYGVRNIEMESCHFAAFTHHLNIPAAVVSCTLIDRSQGDQITMTPKEYTKWLDDLVKIVVRYIKKKIQFNGDENGENRTRVPSIPEGNEQKGDGK